ncbi:MAG TPA: peptidylprolyl isomerase [Candidatus Cryptobacteroides merdipullorum]|uniref:Peptidylprolyl isomerase n=1 Tax=Candidatus Cryptobacteroides merdipullorum TaxID=2840771 RepID=A0A9D1KGX5_9BACT|nr:peptidylprolyl isomerase [Candidatus Cryptobacteroides merdipullorum]
MNRNLKLFLLIAFSVMSLPLSAQRYGGVVDKSIAVVGNEMIRLSDLESEVQMLNAQGYSSDKNIRCELLERMMESKLFLMQARVDSLTVDSDMVAASLTQRLDQVRTALGGDAQVEEYFGMPLYRLRQEWQAQLEEQSLTQKEQQQIASKIPELTPYDVKQYLDTADVSSLPVIPMKYQMSQICVYPDREAAALAVKERLLSLRERIINGEKFATLARLYSEDPGSAMKGGELGMASKSIFWPAFSDAAMSLKPGTISQIVETPDGFHIIEVLEKNGDMFNARHILIKPHYTQEDQDKAFERLDSLRTMIVVDSVMTFDLAARFYSEDPATRTNGGQMADPNTGSSYFEIDQLKPQDYEAVKDLEVGEVSQPIASLDNEGRDGNLVYKIIRLDKIVPAHTANFESDYTDLLNLVVQMKQMEAIDGFIDEKLDSTYIVIDPLFGDCDFSREGWAQKVRKDD